MGDGIGDGVDADAFDLVSGESATPADPLPAAAAALARARAAARDRGLRPGTRPVPGSRARGASRGRTSGYAGSGPDARDPVPLAEQVERLLRERSWGQDISAGVVMGRWAGIVGEEVAAHSAPVSFAAGVLTVRADSTAWATNLRLLSSTLAARIEAEVGPDVVTELRVVGPAAPSWSRGLRRSGGRGPRDTYG